MTLGRLLLRNLFFHWRGNLAVLLGVRLKERLVDSKAAVATPYQRVEPPQPREKTSH